MKPLLTKLSWFVLPLCFTLTTGHARELAVPESELVAVELATVGITPLTGSPVALLRDPESDKLLPIFIGAAEARAILLALRDISVPRPMTHDLMADLLQTFDAELEHVIVDRLSENTYYGFLRLRIGEGEKRVLVDTRPSDGMALAARTGAPILVAPDVLEAAAQLPYEGLSADEQVATAMGITVVKLTDELREAMTLPDKPGVLVSGVENLTGAATGIQIGAVILEVNGEPVKEPMEFLERVGETPADKKASLSYWQNGEETTIELPTTIPGRSPEEEI